MSFLLLLFSDTYCVYRSIEYLLPLHNVYGEPSKLQITTRSSSFLKAVISLYSDSLSNRKSISTFAFSHIRGLMGKQPKSDLELNIRLNYPAIKTMPYIAVLLTPSCIYRYGRQHLNLSRKIKNHCHSFKDIHSTPKVSYYKKLYQV